jgi:hypothetical protein
MEFYRAYPVLDGIRYYVATAQGRKEKAIAEAKAWIETNRLDRENFVIELIEL